MPPISLRRRAPERAVFVTAPFPAPLLSSGLLPEDAVRLATTFQADTEAAVAGLTPPVALHRLPADEASAIRASNLSAPSGVHTAPFSDVLPSGNSAPNHLVDAFKRGFDAGYRTVCMVGGNAPHFPAAFYTEAFGRLEHGIVAGNADVVLGPADDGGCVLIALREEQRARHAALLEGIAWGTDAMLSEILVRAETVGLRPSLLPRWYDIKRPDDLVRLRTDLRRGTCWAPRTRDLIETLEIGST